MSNKSSRNIQNPEKWVGRYVRHMANHRKYAYTPEFFVCEISGKLYRHEDDVMSNIPCENQERAEQFLDPCYTYAWQTIEAQLPDLWQKINS